MLNILILPDLVAKNKQAWMRFYSSNKRKIQASDLKIFSMHQRISQKYNCLACANCCKSLGPLVTDKDVERLAKFFRIKPVQFIDTYLKMDEDGDMVFKSMPCPFLDANNYCIVYKSRPKACSEYPHTDRKKFVQLYNMSVKNAETCPIAFEVIQEIQHL